MQVSTRGAFAIAIEEGVVPTRYRDIAGVDTFGVGHTAAAGDPDPRTMTFAMPANVTGSVIQALKVYERDLQKYTDEVLRTFGSMQQHELDGWVSWHFNTGGAFSSRAVKLWRAGKKVDAVAVMLEWNKVTVKGKKQVSPVLSERRLLEAEIITKAKYPSGKTIPVWPTDGKGRVVWKALSQIDLQEYAMLVGARPQTTTSDGKPVEPVKLPRAPSDAAGPVIGGGLIAAAVIFWDQIKGAFEWLTNIF